MLQPQVGNGINDRQVALHTGQDVKEHLCRKSHVTKIEPYFRHHCEVSVGAADVDGEGDETSQLHGSGVVGKEVGVTRCLPPLPVPQVEDESGEREEEKDFGDDESFIHANRHVSQFVLQLLPPVYT
ncbi:uncharacterized protein LOC127360585 isoform X2 [Dicentrarchus labrax]|uniref:uncharacterized protein LOC127360585 isoform X2 n=1 Tax=Dicentrarchus labrax TaxID=13489 RepID=UPI0021F5D798|nr:uncharacterized protein LOC127360585 isoform X2 [Dicentrarchus labrax]